MSLLSFKNPWGSAGSGIDQQRADLFYVLLTFPSILQGAQGSSLWDQECAFAVSNFPFPDRTREFIAVKYLNQTNFQIGADTAMAPIDINVRYAFNKRTAELLERWHQLTSNSQTGGVALTSAVKTHGYFYWLIPNMDAIANVQDVSVNDALTFGAKYRLEGCLVRNLKPSTADMTQSNQGVDLTFSLQIDRYYPEDVTDLDAANFASAASQGNSDVISGINS